MNGSASRQLGASSAGRWTAEQRATPVHSDRARARRGTAPQRQGLDKQHLCLAGRAVRSGMLLATTEQLDSLLASVPTRRKSVSVPAAGPSRWTDSGATCWRRPGRALERSIEKWCTRRLVSPIDLSDTASCSSPGEFDQAADVAIVGFMQGFDVSASELVGVNVESRAPRECPMPDARVTPRGSRQRFGRDVRCRSERDGWRPFRGGIELPARRVRESGVPAIPPRVQRVVPNCRSALVCTVHVIARAPACRSGQSALVGRRSVRPALCVSSQNDGRSRS
jgi:hypothetical protein